MITGTALVKNVDVANDYDDVDSATYDDENAVGRGNDDDDVDINNDNNKVIKQQ